MLNEKVITIHMWEYDTLHSRGAIRCNTYWHKTENSFMVFFFDKFKTCSGCNNNYWVIQSLTHLLTHSLLTHSLTHSHWFCFRVWCVVENNLWCVILQQRSLSFSLLDWWILMCSSSWRIREWSSSSCQCSTLWENGKVYFSIFYLFFYLFFSIFFFFF